MINGGGLYQKIPKIENINGSVGETERFLGIYADFIQDRFELMLWIGM
jgi:hypothetical protein